MHEQKQNGHTKKRKRPEFWIFVRVDFYWTSNVENVEKNHKRPKRVICLSIKFHDISSVAQLNSQDSKFLIRFKKNWKLTNLEPKTLKFLQFFAQMVKTRYLFIVKCLWNYICIMIKLSGCQIFFSEFENILNWLFYD